MIASGDEEDGGGVGADTVLAEQARSVAGDEGDDELVEVVDLIGEELGSSPQLS